MRTTQSLQGLKLPAILPTRRRAEGGNPGHQSVVHGALLVATSCELQDPENSVVI